MGESRHLQRWKPTRRYQWQRSIVSTHRPFWWPRRKGSQGRQEIDPLALPTIMPCIDHCFHTCGPSVRPLFSKSRKTKHFLKKIVFTTDGTVGLAEEIIDDTCAIIISAKFGD